MFLLSEQEQYHQDLQALVVERENIYAETNVEDIQIAAVEDRIECEMHENVKVTKKGRTGVTNIEYELSTTYATVEEYEQWFKEEGKKWKK